MCGQSPSLMALRRSRSVSKYRSAEVAIAIRPSPGRFNADRTDSFSPAFEKRGISSRAVLSPNCIWASSAGFIDICLSAVATQLSMPTTTASTTSTKRYRPFLPRIFSTYLPTTNLTCLYTPVNQGIAGMAVLIHDRVMARSDHRATSFR